MAYTFKRIAYGSLPWQYMEFAVPSGATGPVPCIVGVMEGGFKVRDLAAYTDPAARNSPPILAGAVYRATSGYEEGYAIASVNVASVTHQQQKAAQDVQAWTSGASYTADERVGFSGVIYAARFAHVASGSNDPSASPLTWRTILENEIGSPLVEGRGEMTPGYGIQAAIDVATANAYLRTYSTALGLNGKLLNHGRSAGAYNIMQALAMDRVPVAGAGLVTGAHVGKASSSSRPDAVIVEICPSQLDNFITQNNPNNDLVRGFLPAFFGWPGVDDFTKWSEVPVDVKRSVDPYWIMSETRVSVPTYLSTPLSYWDNRTESQVYNGDPTGSPMPDVHHALHSKKLFELLTGDAASGGLERTDCVHLDRDPSASFSYRRNTAYPGGVTGTLGTHYTILGADVNTFAEVQGEDQLAWAAPFMV